MSLDYDCHHVHSKCRYKGMHILQKKSSVCKYCSRYNNVSSEQYFHTLFFSK